MSYTGDENSFLERIGNKGKLLEALADESQIFTKEELAEIIHNQFFNDESTLDLELVDAVLIRIMLLDGIKVTSDSLQSNREQMIRQVLKEILGVDNTACH